MQAAQQILRIDNLDVWLKRGSHEIFSVTAMVDPAMAERLLANNPGNRPLLLKGASRSVEAYAKAMARGEWRLNGEHVIVSRDGLLNDGQHRLNAIIVSGVPVPLHLTFGVDRDSRHTVDQGGARTPGHILAMAGEQNYNTLATTLNFVWWYTTGESFNARATTEQLLQTLEAHPEVRAALEQVTHAKKDFRVSVGILGGAHYVCRMASAEQADHFLAAVCSGLNISDPKSPVFRLRKRFIDHTAKKENIPAVEQAALYIKAFNATLQNRSTGQLQWRRYGPTAEDFPVAGR